MEPSIQGVPPNQGAPAVQDAPANRDPAVQKPTQASHARLVENEAPLFAALEIPPPLESPDPQVRRAAGHALASGLSADVSGAFAKGDVAVCCGIMQAVAEKGLSWHLPQVREGLRSNDAGLRLLSIEAAAKLLDQEPHYDDNGSRIPARPLSSPPESSVCFALAVCLDDGDARVASAAARALAGIGPVAGRYYIEALSCRSGELRVAAFDAVLERGVAGARSFFPHLLEEGDRSQRLVLAAALGKIGAETRARALSLIDDAREDLLRKLDSPDPGEIGASTEITTGITGLRSETLAAVRLLGKMTLDYSSEVRLAALQALAEIGPGARAARPEIRLALNESKWKLREAAKGALEALGAE